MFLDECQISNALSDRRIGNGSRLVGDDFRTVAHSWSLYFLYLKTQIWTGSPPFPSEATRSPDSQAYIAVYVGAVLVTILPKIHPHVPPAIAGRTMPIAASEFALA